MSKLHELLAVESNLRNQAEACRADLMNTFDKKRTHFSEIRVTTTPLTGDGNAETEVKHTIQSTVDKELDWISEKLAKAINVAQQIDEANTSARADVVLDDGTVLIQSVPATSLLQLEKRIVEIHQFIMSIPTLDPTKGFEPDAASGEGIFKALDVKKAKTEKKFDYVVMVAPTDKHPAQVKELMVDKPVATMVQQEWSSLITVARKGDMVDRVEGLLRAVKQARSRANDMTIATAKTSIGETILNYVFGR